MVVNILTLYFSQSSHIYGPVFYSRTFLGWIKHCPWATLFTRLSSWFGIHGTALNWFRSYLSSRYFRIKCNNDFSYPHTCLCGVPKAHFSALCSTTPLSTLVLSLALNHHLYADDTQLFLSFHPLQHHTHLLTKRSTTDLFLDDCQSSHCLLF